jgi:hypothetical protein
MTLTRRPSSWRPRRAGKWWSDDPTQPVRWALLRRVVQVFGEVTSQNKGRGAVPLVSDEELALQPTHRPTAPAGRPAAEPGRRRNKEEILLIVATQPCPCIVVPCVVDRGCLRSTLFWLLLLQPLELSQPEAACSDGGGERHTAGGGGRRGGGRRARAPPGGGVVAGGICSHAAVWLSDAALVAAAAFLQRSELRTTQWLQAPARPTHTLQQCTHATDNISDPPQSSQDSLWRALRDSHTDDRNIHNTGRTVAGRYRRARASPTW